MLLPVYVSWRNAERVDISSGTVDAKSERSEDEYFASRILNDILVSAFIPPDFLDPFFDNLIQLRQNVASLVLFLLRLELVILGAQYFYYLRLLDWHNQ